MRKALPTFQLQGVQLTWALLPSADSFHSFYAETTLPMGCSQPTTDSGSGTKAGHFWEKLHSCDGRL